MTKIRSTSGNLEPYTRLIGWQSCFMLSRPVCWKIQYWNWHLEPLQLDNSCWKCRNLLYLLPLYSSWWFKCECVVDAPWNDLQLYHKMLEYEGIDPAVARSAIRAFDRHLWYLTAEMVPLSLFSSAVPKEDKQALADRLLVVRPKEGLKKQCGRYGTKFGKSDFRKIPESMKQSTTLADLVKPGPSHGSHLNFFK